MSGLSPAPARLRGPLEFARQFGIIIAAYFLWRLGRGAVDGSTAASVAHAHELVSAERFLHSFVELDLQQWAVSSGWVSDITGFLYAHMHFWGSIAALLYLWFAHNSSFRFVRNAMLVAMAVSLLGYLFYPTAPPRFVDGLGFSNAQEVTGNEAIRSSGRLFFNPYAAVPSMHVALAAIFGYALARLSRPPALKLTFACYPLLMTFVVIATGNHFWLDAAFGAVTASLALGAATLLARRHPSTWSLQAEAPHVGAQPAAEAAPA
ncbi:MAG: phosphatase PAP2 family protein [Solirubrobacterales bacterium]